ncbi:MAG: Holliday junction branch migration protein RuvA [Patescibacteria group bacterium]
MISQIKGKLSYKGIGCAIIDVSGVGYKIHTTLDEVIDMKEGDDVNFWTHLVVKENALDIYGFRNMENLDFFKLLIGVSGIGPKSAMNILTIVDVETLVSAISSGDMSYLTKVSGIGKKNAQKIIIELKDKVEARVGDVAGLKKEDVDVIEALKSLGYTARDARESLKNMDENATTSEKIKSAIKSLNK